MSPLKGEATAIAGPSFEDSDDSLVDEGSSDDFDDDDVPDLSTPRMNKVGQKRKVDQKNRSTAKKSKLNDANKANPLTADELIYLKETENLFQSNVFRLQITELLNETKLKKNCKRHFNAWFQDFSHFLNGLDESEEHELKSTSWLEEKSVRLPVVKPPERLTGSFKFVKPVKTLTVGCFKNGTTLGSPSRADVVLVMPKLIFKKSDKFDGQYFVKRALYLSHVASILTGSQLIAPDSRVEFTTKHGDALKPCLILRPNGKSAKALEVVISAVPESGFFKLTQFTPDKCNVTFATKDEVLSTPHYNSTVCEDLVMEEVEDMKTKIFEANPNLKDAAVLLGVWLKQRSLSQGYGGFNMHIVCMYLVHLFNSRRLNPSMSSNQIIRATWLDLTRSDWAKSGPSLEKEPSETALAHSFYGHHEVVFTDTTGFHNIAFRMNRITFQKVKHEAEFALSLLNKADTNSFPSLFLRDVPFLHQHDHVLCFPDPNIVVRTVEQHATVQSRVDLYQNSPIFVRLVTQLLEKGLGSRLDLIGLNFPDDYRWNINDLPPSYESTGSLMIGLKFQPEAALSVIDKGPPSNSPEGVAFREFWGDKCQLRRFKDGSISESVIWADNSLTIEERRKIVRDVVVFLLNSKLGISETDYCYVGLQLSRLNSIQFSPTRSLEESYVSLHKVFTRISQDLHSLTLPLEIVSIHCVSEGYRFTDPFPPLKSHFVVAKHICDVKENILLLQKGPDAVLPPYTPAVDVVVQMSVSSKWPNDLNACKRLVAAFYVEIAATFAKVKHLKTIATPNYVIVFKEGFIFKIHLAYSKQVALLKQQVNELGLKQYKDTEESIALERSTVNLPKLSGALYGVSQLHSAFGPTCVLAKKWLSSQLFHETHFPAIVVELLVAHLFLSSQPVAVTTRPLPMFLRFLKILSSTNWQLEPIIVNFTETLNATNIADIEKHFTTNRETLPPMFLATSFDTSGALWTKKAPTLPILVRVAKLAAASRSFLENFVVSNGTATEISTIFVPPLSVFHLIIKVDLKLATRRHQRIDFEELLRMKNLKSNCEHIPVFNFDPVAKYVERLEANYSNEALFFYDAYGGTDIGVLLKAQFLQKAPFKVSTFAARVPSKCNGEAITKPNLDGLIEGFKVMGKGLVVEVVNYVKNDVT